ncbi:MAG: hypothetical protein FWG73_05080 [Planctomycetaceae bacterium]|nr:hypothetical protein [Planctomycetaceae bacterium]
MPQPPQQGAGPGGRFVAPPQGAMPGGGPPPWMQNANPQQGQQQGRQGRQAAGQGNPPGGNQAGAMNPNQVSQAIARLRSMDANGNGILETNEIPPNQRERVNAMITQLGGNPNAQQINLANLERRAQNNSQQANNNRQQQQNDNQQGRPQRPQQPPVEPLVRPFGETRPAETPVLGFGQRPATQSAQTAREGGRQREREMAIAQANQQSAVAAARNANTVRQSAVYESIPANVRTNQAFSWFFEYDADQDGQLTMVEYINGRGGVWNNELAREFVSLDRNGDGLVTVEEAWATIREWDAERLQAEAEQAAARPNLNQPAAAPPAATGPGRPRDNQTNTGPNSNRRR